MINIYKKGTLIPFFRFYILFLFFDMRFYSFILPFFVKKKGRYMNELKDITALMLEEIKDKLSSPTIFNLWFGELELLSLTDEVATFKTPTKLRKQILSTKYYDLLKGALDEVIGFNVKIEIVYPEDNSKNLQNTDIDDYTEKKDDEEDAEAEKKKSEIISSFLDNGDIHKNLLKEYTFENFIEGESNKFAKAACYAVAKEPTYYNPLFIYGHSGLGKTHLLYAVINHLKENHPRLKIVYKKSEDFINELINAISHAETAAFKEKYRTADVLLIDDIQFIAGKVSTQEEFFHTFSALYEADKQIILTSDRPPKDIKPHEDRLRTRFEGGLLADVQPPSFELRTAIIRKKADSVGILISNEMVEYMAERLQNNIRQIEGVIKRLYALYSLSGTPVTRESIDQVISIIDPGNIPTDALIEKILTVVASNYGVTVESLKSKKKTDTIANARHVAVYIIRKLTNLSLKSIGAIFGRDHATILASINKVETNIKTVNNAASDIKKLIKEIKG